MLKLHKDGIEEFGGSHGVRDLGLIDSAVAAARNVFEYENSGLPDIASAYIFSLYCNHGFIDGNKRVALRAADVFLAINSHDLDLTNEEAYIIIMRVANGMLTRQEIAEHISPRLKPITT